MCYQVSLINFSRCKSNLMLAGNGLFGTKCRLVDGQFLYRIIFIFKRVSSTSNFENTSSAVQGGENMSKRLGGIISYAANTKPLHGI